MVVNNPLINSGISWSKRGIFWGVGPLRFPMILLMEEILHQLRLVVYPIKIYRVLYIQKVVSRISAINSSTEP